MLPVGHSTRSSPRSPFAAATNAHWKPLSSPPPDTAGAGVRDSGERFLPGAVSGLVAHPLCQSQRAGVRRVMLACSARTSGRGPCPAARATGAALRHKIRVCLGGWGGEGGS